MCLCVSHLECFFSPLHPYKSQYKPTFTTVSPSITWLWFFFVLCPVQPEHSFTLQGFRGDHLCSFLSCNIILPSPSSFFPFLSVCSHPSQFSFSLPRPSGCSLSNPIVAMHISNKLCSSKCYEAHFCSATHCHSIISCYHDMPLRNRLLWEEK